MNKLITTYTGRMPFMLDDIRFVDDAFRKSFEALAKSVSTTTNYILWGCVATEGGGFVTVTDGAVVINGEICQVIAHSIAQGADIEDYWLQLNVTYDPAGTKIWDDNGAVSHDTYQVRKAILTYSAAPLSDGVNPTTGVRISELLTANIVPFLASQNENWHLVGDVGEPDTIYTEWKTGSQRLRFRKDVMGNVFVEGGVLSFNPIGGVPFTDIIFQLPVGYRPDRIIYFPINILIDGGNTGLGYVTTTGELFISMANTVSLPANLFVQIQFRAA